MKRYAGEMIFGLILLLLLAWAGYVMYGKEWLLVREAQAAISAEMFDPDSTNFRAMKKRKSGAVCGEVNAKNRYGAYVGFHKVLYRNPGHYKTVDVIVQPPNSDQNADMLFLIEWDESCA